MCNVPSWLTLVDLKSNLNMGGWWSRWEAGSLSILHREGQGEEKGEDLADLRILGPSNMTMEVAEHYYPKRSEPSSLRILLAREAAESHCAASEPSSLGIARADRRILGPSSMTMGAADRYYLTSEPNSLGIARADLRSLLTSLFLGMATVAAERHCPTISQHDHGSRRIPNPAYSAYPEEISRDHSIIQIHELEEISRDHSIIQIHELEEQAEQGLWAKIKTLGRTSGKKAVNRIDTLIQKSPNAVPAGLISAMCQFISTPLPNGNNSHILPVVNVFGFSFLLIGMVLRGRKSSYANLLLFMGILLSAGGIVFSMSKVIPGILGWFVLAACLFIIMTGIVLGLFGTG